MKNIKAQIEASTVAAKAIFRRTYATASVACFSVLVSAHASAATGGFAKAKGILDTTKDELTTIIPVAATIALLALGIGYAAKFVEKDTFIRWSIGVIIAGSASQLTAMFFT